MGSGSPNFASNEKLPLDPQYHAYILITVISLCLTLLLFFVALRSYVRIWVPRSFSLDDASCLIATTGTIAYSAVILSTINLAGRPILTLPFSAFSDRFFQELVFVYQAMYGPTIFFAKLSLFLLYLRIFSPSRNMRLLIYAGIFVNLCYYVATAAGMMAFCMPRNGESWFLALFSSHCRRARIMTWVQGIFNIVSDLFLLILPMPVVWKLHMPTRKKWGVGAIFATGLLACVASALGLYYRIQLDSDLDWTRHEIGLCSFVVIELTLGIICGCMPYVATTLKSWTLDSGPSSFFKGFRSILSSRRHRKRSKHSRVSSDDLGESQQSQEYRLETRILGTVKGNGRFLDSRNSKQKEWLDRTMVTQQSIGERTIPEAWETADYRADYRV